MMQCGNYFYPAKGAYQYLFALLGAIRGQSVQNFEQSGRESLIVQSPTLSNQNDEHL